MLLWICTRNITDRCTKGPLTGTTLRWVHSIEVYRSGTLFNRTVVHCKRLRTTVWSTKRTEHAAEKKAHVVRSLFLSAGLAHVRLRPNDTILSPTTSLDTRGGRVETRSVPEDRKHDPHLVPVSDVHFGPMPAGR